MGAPRFGCSLSELATWYLNASIGWSAPGAQTDIRPLYRTTDGGRRWRRVGRLPANLTGSFAFVSTNVGFILSDAGLLTTRDGGEQWTLTVPNLVRQAPHSSGENKLRVPQADAFRLGRPAFGRGLAERYTQQTTVDADGASSPAGCRCSDYPRFSSSN